MLLSSVMVFTSLQSYGNSFQRRIFYFAWVLEQSPRLKQSKSLLLTHDSLQNNLNRFSLVKSKSNWLILLMTPHHGLRRNVSQPSCCCVRECIKAHLAAAIVCRAISCSLLTLPSNGCMCIYQIYFNIFIFFWFMLQYINLMLVWNCKVWFLVHLMAEFERSPRYF
jgi:hypothetical protein